MTHICPCCGSKTAVSVDIEDMPEHAGLTGMQSKIFAILAKRPGRFVTSSATANQLYGDDPTGGPNDLLNVLAAHTYNIRGKVEPFGVSIVGTRGPHNSRYKLIMVAAP